MRNMLVLDRKRVPQDRRKTKRIRRTKTRARANLAGYETQRSPRVACPPSLARTLALVFASHRNSFISELPLTYFSKRVLVLIFTYEK